VVDVPAKLAAWGRLQSAGHDRKSDEAAAISAGIAALTAAGLHTVAIDETAIALRAEVALSPERRCCLPRGHMPSRTAAFRAASSRRSASSVSPGEALSR
jgi:hypothetical protein